MHRREVDIIDIADNSNDSLDVDADSISLDGPFTKGRRIGTGEGEGEGEDKDKDKPGQHGRRTQVAAKAVVGRRGLPLLSCQG